MTIKGPEVLDPESVDMLDSVVGVRMAAALADIATERGGARRFQLNEQMMVLWDGPEFKAKAARPADEILPVMLHRAWHDLRGVPRAARRDGTDTNLHKLRIRLKDLLDGSETVALIAGGPARKTARAGRGTPRASSATCTTPVPPSSGSRTWPGTTVACAICSRPWWRCSTTPPGWPARAGTGS